MRNILVALLLAPLVGAFSCAPAFAQKTKAQLTTEVSTTFPDNTTGLITASGVRTFQNDLINSIMPTAPVVSGNLACFNGTTGLLQDCGSSPTANAITALTGDIMAAGPGSVAATLATVNANVGSFGSATACSAFTVNGKGLVTAASSSTCTPAVGSITGLGTGVATWLATPSSANLATAVTDETGTGALVFAGSPALTGTPTAPTAAAGTNTTQIATTAGIVAERAATKTLTNTTFNSTDAGNVLQVGGVTVFKGQFPGTTTNDNATAGNTGQYVESSVAVGAAISLTSATPANITSISLTAGDWDITLNPVWGGTTTSVTGLRASISTTSNTEDSTTPGRFISHTLNSTSPFATFNAALGAAGPSRLSLAGTTTVYFVGRCDYSGGTCIGYGIIRARRMR